MHKRHHHSGGILDGSTRIVSGGAVTVAWIAVCLVVLGGCGGGAWRGFPVDAAPERVWPDSPETPRVVWVAEFRKHDDLYTLGGGFSRLARWVAGPPDSRMMKPFALALRPNDGGILVVDSGRNVVHDYRWRERKYAQIGPKMSGGLRQPTGVGLLTDGRILVSDSRLGTVEAFDDDGGYMGAFCAAGVLQRPAGIAVDGARGRVYVADVVGQKIGVFDFGGKVIGQLGERGDQAGYFNFPTHIALDGEGDLIVCDSMNFRVQCIRPDGTPVAALGKLGDSPGQFARPKGVAADRAGNVIAVESLYGALLFFSPDGQFLLNVGASGHGPGEFWLPAGLALDAERNLLYVADSYNGRVQVFRLLDAARDPKAGSTP